MRKIDFFKNFFSIHVLIKRNEKKMRKIDFFKNLISKRPD
jgi:hypothetical protein